MPGRHTDAAASVLLAFSLNWEFWVSANTGCQHATGPRHTGLPTHKYMQTNSLNMLPPSGLPHAYCAYCEMWLFKCQIEIDLLLTRCAQTEKVCDPFPINCFTNCWYVYRRSSMSGNIKYIWLYEQLLFRQLTWYNAAQCGCDLQGKCYCTRMHQHHMSCVLCQGFRWKGARFFLQRDHVKLLQTV